MSRNFLIIEKSISTILILWGCLISTSLQIAFDYSHVTWSNISFIKIFKNHYFEILQSLLAILGGLFLIFNKKIGWGASFIMSIISSLFLLLAIIKPHSSTASQLELLPLRIILSVLFFAMAFTLTLSPFRIKYYPTIKTCLLIAFCATVLTIFYII